MVQNSLVRSEQKKFSVAIQGEGYRNLINNTLGDPKVAQRFISSITSAVAVNPALQECDPGTILSAAFLGESLNLSPSPQLGQYYLVPFNDKKNNRTVATFILGYKGYLQLAIRSGYYKKINVLALKDGELINYDPLNEIVEAHLVEDDEEREKTPTTGYYAMFEYQNGFKKAMYWSKKKMMAHADKYSAAFSAATLEKIEAGKIAKEDMWKYSSFWYKSFDDMALKTMLRQLISKWGIMSVELQKAYERDETFAESNSKFEYVSDMEPPSQNPEPASAAAEPEEKPARRTGKKNKENKPDPLEGTPFAENEDVEIQDVPDFVTQVEMQQQG